MRRPIIRYVQKLKLILVKQHIQMPVQHIATSSDLHAFFNRLHAIEGDYAAEHFYVAYLNKAKQLTGYTYLAKGGIDGVVADIRLIMAGALKSNCTTIAVCHNHPSGSLRPSDADVSLTRQLKEVAALHTINILDHLILTENGYFSFMDEGLL